MVHIRSKEDCKALVSDHGETVFELLGAAAGGAELHSLAHIELPPGKASLPHYHPAAEESYYILSGTARLVVDGATYHLHPGQVIAITPGMTHRIFNDGTDTLHFLAICAPAWTPTNSVYVDA